MKIDHFELTIDKAPDNRTFYFAGEEIQGHIELHVAESTQITRLSIKLQGVVHAGWWDKKTGHHFESRSVVVNEYSDFTDEVALHSNEVMEILPGRHRIDFKFRIPMDAISSFSKEGCGSVRYTCVGTIDIPDGGDSELVADSEFKVLSLLNLDAPHLRRPVHSQEHITIVWFWSCSGTPRGRISADVCVAELGLLPGETTRISITVENTAKKASVKKHPSTGDHSCAVLSLCQQLDFRAHNKSFPVGLERRSITTAIQNTGTCKANYSAKGPEIRFVEVTIPENLPPTSVKDDGLITISYFFRLDMGQFDVIVPIVIGSKKTPKKHSHTTLPGATITENGIERAPASQQEEPDELREQRVAKNRRRFMKMFGRNPTPRRK